MRKYKITPKNEKIVHQAFCNCCGREIKKDTMGYFEDYLHIEKKWNYFSSKDEETYIFDLCEECFDKWVKGFLLSPKQE